MNTYIITICRTDGTTPLGKCPKFEVNGINYLDAQNTCIKNNPDHEVVSWGLKADIEAYEKLHGISEKIKG